MSYDYALATTLRSTWARANAHGRRVSVEDVAVSMGLPRWRRTIIVDLVTRGEGGAR